MNGRFTIGRVRGIPVRIHVSWFVIFALVTWSLAQGYFPAAHPGWEPGTYWLVGAMAAVLFFASVLVHELGHSLVALRHGVPIRSITLFVFGGVAHTGQEPATPGVELRIAVAGPATSAALAALFWGLGLVAGPVGVLAVPLAWLARVNLMVALFNLIPGFPLDGGRVLRAAAWRWTGSLHRGTQVAAFAGQVAAAGLIGIGMFLAIRGSVVNGVWLILLGWFLQGAATSSQTQAGLQALLRGVTVEQAMTRDCRRVDAGWTLERLVRDEILGAGQRCVVVVEGPRLRGLVTLHEVKAVPREHWPRIRVADVMTPVEKLAVIGPRDDVLAALERMDDASVAQLPVVAGEELVGMIGREQILHYVRVRAELGV